MRRATVQPDLNRSTWQVRNFNHPWAWDYFGHSDTHIDFDLKIASGIIACSPWYRSQKMRATTVTPARTKHWTTTSSVIETTQEMAVPTMTTSLSPHGLVFPPHWRASTKEVTKPATRTTPPRSRLNVCCKRCLRVRLLRSDPRGGEAFRNNTMARTEAPPMGRLM